MKILYFDPVGGISGDMAVACLIDLGAPLSVVRKALEHLGVDKAEVSVSARRSKSGAMSGKKFDVKSKLAVKSSRRKPKSRTFASISKMISRSKLPKEVKDTSLAIFSNLAEAEAKVHGVLPAEVHFHEVGAIDSITDIVGFAACFHHLGIDQVHVGPLPVASGRIKTESHGKLPLPAPATLILLQGFDIRGFEADVETVTPTGAAILSALAKPADTIPAMKLEAVGTGIGSRNPSDDGVPNVLRALMGEETDDICNDEIYVINANIDDMNPQDYDMLMEKLFEAGALDVALVNAHMKRNRPGIILEAQSPLGKFEDIAETIFSYSTTIGLRYYRTKRITLQRVVTTVGSPIGKIRVKKSSYKGREIRAVPEHADLVAGAHRAKVGLPAARELIKAGRPRKAVKAKRRK